MANIDVQPVRLFLAEARESMAELGSALRWVAFGNVIQQVSSFVSTIIVARMLGASAFGLFAFIQSTVAFMGVFAGFGLSVTITIAIARYKTIDKRAAGEVLGGTFVTGTIFCLAVSVASVILGYYRPEVFGLRELSAGSIWSGVALLLATSSSGLIAGAVSGFEDFNALARSAIVRGIAGIVFMSTGAQWWGSTGALFGSAISVAFSSIYLLFRLRDRCRKDSIPIRISSPARIRELLFGSALPSFLSSLLSVPVNWYCNRLLLSTENGQYELGLLTATSQYRTVLAFIPAVIGQVILPKMASDRGAGRSGRRGAMSAAGVAGGVALLLSILLVSGRGALMGLYGREFTGRDELFHLVVLTGIIFAVQAPLSNALVARGRLWANTLLVLGGAVAQGGIAKVLINGGYGAEGIAWSTAISYALQVSALLLWVLFYFSKREAPLQAEGSDR